MATREEIYAFIEKIAPCAQEGYRTIGKILPSICIGMAAVECAWGKAGSVKHNSLMGQKVGSGKTATKYWSGKFFKSKTKEEYTIGVHTTITDAFRAYDSWQQCVLNYYELLNTKLYARVQAGVDYRTQMQQIKQCKYMTSSTEVNSVCSIIEKYNLTQYDNLEAATVCNSNRYVTTAHLLNLRSGPGSSYEDVGTLAKGSDIVTDREENGWLHVEGWISKKYVKAMPR